MGKYLAVLKYGSWRIYVEGEEAPLITGLHSEEEANKRIDLMEVLDRGADTRQAVVEAEDHRPENSIQKRRVGSRPLGAYTKAGVGKVIRR